MGSRNYPCRYGRPVEAALDVVGGRWKGVILFYLLQSFRRFGELRRLLPTEFRQARSVEPAALAV